jgi:hypothetical protein
MIGYLFLASILSFILIFFYRRYNISKNKLKPFLYYVGLGHIIIGIPLIPSFLFLVAMYFLIIGIIFFLISHKINNFKIQLTLLFTPMIILISFFLYEESSKNIFLIPENYKGRILIVHDCEQGQPKEFEGWFWRKYKIAEDGVAYSQFSWTGHSFDHLNSKYFYVDRNGNRTELHETYSNEENLESQKIPKVFGLWSLPKDSLSSKTNIDFIIDDEYSNPFDYHDEDITSWIQKSKSCD